MTQHCPPFVGWIPCISGRLLFRHLSCSHPRAKNNLEVNHREQSSDGSIYRYIVLSSEIDWKDLDESDLTDGVFHLIVTGLRDEADDNFYGFVFLLPLQKAKKDHNWTAIEEHIYSIRRSAIKREHIAHSFNQLNDRLSAYSDTEYYSVRFNITDRGFAFLEYTNTAAAPASKLHQTTICRQAFYFLKYSLHKHQHHHRDDDSLTTIHPIPENPESLGPLLIDDLRKGLVEIKRRLDALQYESLYQGRGIVSYAKSLIESCHAQGFLSHADYSRCKCYFDNVGDSLNILAEKRQRDATRRLEASNHSRSWILFWMAVVGPLVIVFKDQIVSNIETSTNTSTYAVKLISSILGNDLHFVATIILVSAIYGLNLAFRSKWPEPMRKIKGSYYLLEAIVNDTFKAKVVATVFLLVAVVVISFSILSILP